MEGLGRLSSRVRNEFAGRIAGAARIALWVSVAAGVNYTIGAMSPSAESQFKSLPTAYAMPLNGGLSADGFPEDSSWKEAYAIQFDWDWQGRNADPQRETEVRVLWSAETLFLRFRAHYREVYVFPDARPGGWRDELWERDVAEAFLQPDESDPLVYKELEVSPNGFWIDLDISHGQRAEMHSGLRRRVTLDEKSRTWTAELALPMKSLTNRFDSRKQWRVNFYRVEGHKEPRFYSAWSPTMSAMPNFHVPEAFGVLEFRDERK